MNRVCLLASWLVTNSPTTRCISVALAVFRHWYFKTNQRRVKFIENERVLWSCTGSMSLSPTPLRFVAPYVRDSASDVTPLSNPRRRLQERRQQDGECNFSPKLAVKFNLVALNH